MNGRKVTEQVKAHRPERSVADEIVAALEDFKDALEKGDVYERFTCHQIRLDLHPAPYTAEQVRSARRVLGVSQSLFAKFLGVSLNTVRSWEQGVNTPSKMACRFMDEIRRSPKHWKERLREVAVRCDRGEKEAAR